AVSLLFFFQAEDGIRDFHVTGVQTCALPIFGNSPWTVLSEGVALHSPLSIGVATIAIGAAVLLAWLPLQERVGLGTVANTVVIRSEERRVGKECRSRSAPSAKNTDDSTATRE